MENYRVLVNIISSLEDDLKKFYENGNKAAGTRARNQLKEVKKLAQEIRVDLLKKKIFDCD